MISGLRLRANSFRYFKSLFPMEKFTFTVTEEEAGIPLKKLIRAKYHFSSRLMTKIKYQDLLMLNGKRVPGYFIAEVGDTVTVSIPDEISGFEPEDISISVIYEDDDLLIINKQRGVTCHPTKGHPNHTMANGIMKYMLDTDQSFKIRFVNRLDMDTSGVLVIAKNSHAQAELNKQMMNDLTEKKYYLLVHGKFSLESISDIQGVTVSDEEALIDLPIGRPYEDSKKRAVLSEDMEAAYPSRTIIKLIEVYDEVSLLEAKLLTGRTHQIRVHLSHLGYPLVGDELYGNKDLDVKYSNITGQALHAYSFGCYHPISGEWMEFTAPPPLSIFPEAIS